MKLNDFLLERGVTKSAFADRIGTTVATVSRIGDGHVVPRRELLERIHEATDGLVTPNDLVGLHGSELCSNAVDSDADVCRKGNSETP